MSWIVFLYSCIWFLLFHVVSLQTADNGCPSFEQHCPDIYKHLQCGELGPPSINRTIYPMLLHHMGVLYEREAKELQQHVAEKAAKCNASRSVLTEATPVTPVVVGLPHDDHFEVGFMHAFLFDNLQCHDGLLYQVFMYNDEHRLRVRCTHLGNGLTLAYFFPLEPGVYTVEATYQYPTPPVKKTRWPRFGVMDVKNWNVTVTASGGRHLGTDTTEVCKKVPYAGRWVNTEGNCRPPYCSGDLEQLMNSTWVYQPFGCHLHLRTLKEVQSCLDKRWILFHGDSTMEENSIWMVKRILNGQSEMEKQSHSDEWREYDVAVFHNHSVVAVPPNTSSWRHWAEEESTRVTMRFNPSHTLLGKPHHLWDCDGLKMYTERCTLSYELIDMFQQRNPPDVFVFSSLNWDLFCYPVETFRDQMQEVAALFTMLHELSPGTLFIYRTCYGAITPYRTHKLSGAVSYERYLQPALDIINRLPFVRIVDAYDMVQPWSSTGHTGDGIHLWSSPELRFIESIIMQVIVHEACTHFEAQ